MSCISISNDECLIYVLVFEWFTMFIFGILASWKCDFCSFVIGSY